MRSLWIRPSLSLTTRKHINREVMQDENRFKVSGKICLAAVLAFVGTFTLYMANGENKLIYYVIRPLLNKHYDSQVRDRRIV